MAARNLATASSLAVMKADFHRAGIMRSTSRYSKIIGSTFRLSSLVGLLTLVLAVSRLCAQGSAQINLQSGDGYVRREGNEWILGTSLTEKRIRLSSGQFSMISLRNKVSGREYQDATNPPAE